MYDLGENVYKNQSFSNEMFIEIFASEKKSLYIAWASFRYVRGKEFSMKVARMYQKCGLIVCKIIYGLCMICFFHFMALIF